MKHRVAVVASDQSYLEALKKAFQLLNFDPERWVGKSVCLAPSLQIRKAESGETTSSLLVEALIEILQDYGARSIVVLQSDDGESSAEVKYRRLGYDQMASRGGVRLANLTREKKYPVKIEGEFFRSIEVPEVMMASDLLVTVSPLKIDRSTVISCALKNQLSLVGELGLESRLEDKLEFAPEALCDSYTLYKTGLVVADASHIRTGKHQVVEKKGLLLVGVDSWAVDAASCSLFGIDRKSVPYLRHIQTHKGPFGLEIVGENPNDYVVEIPIISSLLPGASQRISEDLYKKTLSVAESYRRKIVPLSRKIDRRIRRLRGKYR